jgi:hypothetical protein
MFFGTRIDGMLQLFLELTFLILALAGGYGIISQGGKRFKIFFLYHD